MTSRINQHELESYLWGAATLLRGLVDASDVFEGDLVLRFIEEARA